MNIKEYIVNKLQELSKYGIEYPEEKINAFYNSMIEQNLSDEEMKTRVDEAYENSIKELEKKRLDDLAREGGYSNFEQIKKVFNYLMDSPIAKYLSVYGGSVPYLMKDQVPKRLIGDIDLHVSLENMDVVRNFIQQNKDIIKVDVDTLDYSNEDFGCELIIDNLNVSIFPTIETPEGRITNNFNYSKATDSVNVTSTLFYGIHDENETIQTEINGRQAKVCCPEYIYIQKSISMREKDVIDLEVLQPMINHEKVSYLKSVQKTPAILKKETLKKGGDTKTIE